MSTNPALFKRNLNALKPWFSKQLAAEIDQSSAFDLEVIRNAETHEFENIGLGEGVFYPEPADTHALKQVLAFSESPNAVDFSDAIQQQVHDQYLWDQNTEGQFASSLLARLEGNPKPGPVNADYTPGFFISFGLGAGCHIEHVVSRFDFKDLIVCEGYLDFLLLSMHVVDWVTIVDKVTARGGRLHFILNTSATAVLRELNLVIQKSHIGLIEGSFLFQHHNFSPVDEVVASLPELLRQVIQYNGWLEDEITHARNIAANRKYNGTSSLLNAATKLRLENPVLIVGSGPSLERDLPRLKERQDRFIVVSCGSALQALMEAGITPDFHCEMENALSVGFIVGRTAKKFDLRPITLLASCTVVPVLAQYFNNTIFFPREGNSFSSILYEDQVGFSGRTATISALSIFMGLGAQHIFLMGVDFALGPEKETHCKNTVYETDSLKFGQGSGANREYVAVKGTCRETVLTNTTWSYMRYGMEMAVLHFRANGSSSQVWNVSDGAAIENIPYLSLDEVLVQSKSLPDKSSAAKSGDRLFNLFQTNRMGKQDRSHVLPDVREALAEITELGRKMLKLVESTDDSRLQYEWFYTQFCLRFSDEEIAGKSKNHQAVWRLFHPIILRAFHYINHRLRRMDKPSQQIWTAKYVEEFFSFFDAILCRFHAEMAGLTLDLGGADDGRQAYASLKPESGLASFFETAWRDPILAVGMLENLKLDPVVWRYVEMVVYKRIWHYRGLFLTAIVAGSDDHRQIGEYGLKLNALKFAIMACFESEDQLPLPEFPARIETVMIANNIRRNNT